MSEPALEALVEDKVCNLCNTRKSLSEFHGNGYQPNGRKKYKPSCRQCSNSKDYKQFYTRLSTALAVIGKSWECEVCGYDKNLSAIAFHHIDPSLKSFEISKRRHGTVETFVDELKKCAVLCQNCHAEHHSPQLLKEKVFEELEIPFQ